MCELKIRASEEEILILEKRAENLSKEVKIGNETYNEKDDYFLFEINSIRYAIDKFYIQELHPEVKPKKVPNLPDFIKGIINIRGEIVSVNDISSFLGNEAIREKNSYQMIKVKREKLDFGILIDQAIDIIKINNTEIFSFKNSDNKTIDKYLKGVTQDMINIIDLEKVFSDESILIGSL